MLDTPKGLIVRPTTDFAKTGLFNILRNRFSLEEMKCLDLFAGTGNITFELCSEGSNDVTAIDVSEKCIAYIRKVSATLQEPGIHVMRADVFEFLKRCHTRYDLIFADPPYERKDKSQIHELISSRGLLNPGGVFILEHQSKETFSDLKGFESVRTYGNVAFSFFSNLDAETELP